RHSLTHQDELRSIKSSGKEVRWRLTAADDEHRHLETVRTRAGIVMIQFQPRSFYKDIVAVCQRAQHRRWSGEVKKRYNGWMTLDLDSARSNSTINAAKTEIAAL
ncbi:unnamed protein product, partial [marine sediment metagenome]